MSCVVAERGGEERKGDSLHNATAPGPILTNPITSQIRVVTAHGKNVANRIGEGQASVRVLQDFIVDVLGLRRPVLEKRAHGVDGKLRVAQTNTH